MVGKALRACIAWLETPVLPLYRHAFRGQTGGWRTLPEDEKQRVGQTLLVSFGIRMAITIRTAGARARRSSKL